MDVCTCRNSACRNSALYPYILSVCNVYEGTEITYLEATDPDDDQVSFKLVGDARVLAAGPLLRVGNTAHQRASVFLNAPLNALVCTHTRLSVCLSVTQTHTQTHTAVRLSVRPSLLLTSHKLVHNLITAAVLRHRHLLPVSQRSEFKLAVVVYTKRCYR